MSALGLAPAAPQEAAPTPTSEEVEEALEYFADLLDSHSHTYAKHLRVVDAALRRVSTVTKPVADVAEAAVKEVKEITENIRKELKP